MINPTKIFINTLPVHNATGGMKTFLLELLNAFADSKNTNIEYCLICSKSNSNVFDEVVKNEKIKRIIIPVNSLNIVVRVFFEQLKMNQLFKKEKNAILLNICNVAVMKCSIPQVTILQAPLSLSSLRKTLPSKYILISTLHKIYYDLFVMRSVNISAKTIAVSEFMRQFLKKYDNKIEVIHEGVNFKQFQQISDNLSGSKTDSYILSVSTLFPYKNMDKLIIAYSILKKRGCNQKLYIAGRDPDGKQLDILKKLTKDLELVDDVNFVGLVPYNKVPDLYKNAELFMFLSSVETFGLPVLEAMVSGVPVIASNAMSVPEVVNEAGILVDPNDVQEIAKKMEEVLSNPALKKSLIEKGKENIKLFNWKTTAVKFEKIFEQVAKTII